MCGTEAMRPQAEQPLAASQDRGAEGSPAAGCSPRPLALVTTGGRMVESLLHDWGSLGAVSLANVGGRAGPRLCREWEGRTAFHSGETAVSMGPRHRPQVCQTSGHSCPTSKGLLP